MLVRCEEMPGEHVFEEGTREEKKESSCARWTAEGGCPYACCPQTTKIELGDALVGDGRGAEREIAGFRQC